jgi:hypothetical protein
MGNRTRDLPACSIVPQSRASVSNGAMIINWKDWEGSGSGQLKGGGE